MLALIALDRVANLLTLHAFGDDIVRLVGTVAIASELRVDRAGPKAKVAFRLVLLTAHGEHDALGADRAVAVILTGLEDREAGRRSDADGMTPGDANASKQGKTENAKGRRAR